MTTTAFAEGKCEGGVPFEGVSDGHEYCISKVSLNWWSAFEWCQQQGRHLASLKEACGNLYGAWGPAACGNLVKSGITAKHCWTATPDGSTNTYNVYAGTGKVNNVDTSRRHGYYALCY